MRTLTCSYLTLLTLGSIGFPALAQDAGQGPGSGSPAVNGVAATVNGQPISELTVQRGLKRLPAEKRAEARKEILDYLIDNVLVDQYLQQLRVDVAKKDVDDRVSQIHNEIKKQGQTLEKVMEQLMLNEDELRAQITADLRWEKFTGDQITEKDIREVFDRNPEMFDGTMVRARHILLTPAAGDAQAASLAKQELEQIKKELEGVVATGLAKLALDADNLARERARNRIMDDAFVAVAQKKSTCPSKEQGGDLGWFARSGNMVEPFAKAAFALKPFTLSDVVSTQFGYHLILLTDRRPGKETKFEDVKEVVRDICCDRLRESLCGKLKPTARIVLTPPVKP